MERDWGFAHRTLARLDAECKGNVCFLQIGANDGILADPCVRLAKQSCWRGIVVEPVPAYYRQLCATYQESSSIECINLAVGNTEGLRRIHFVKPELIEQQKAETGNYWLQGCASFNIEHLLEHGVAAQDCCSMLVETVRGETLIRKYALEQCDALIVDVEGAEAAVLESFDFSVWRPGCVVFESEHLTQRERHKVSCIFESNGYVINWSRPDSAALLRGD